MTYVPDVGRHWIQEKNVRAKHGPQKRGLRVFGRGGAAKWTRSEAKDKGTPQSGLCFVGKRSRNGADEWLPNRQPELSEVSCNEAEGMEHAPTRTVDGTSMKGKEIAEHENVYW